MASSRLLILVALAAVVGLALCQEEDNSQESGVIFGMETPAAGAAATRGLSSPFGLRCGRVYLRSYYYRFRRYRIPVAIEVLSLALLKEFSNGMCKADATYGKYGTDVWVNGGCRGLFAICIIPGYNKIVPCYSIYYKPQRCYVGKYIKRVYISRHKSASPCVEGFSYRIDGQELVVFNGCRADFIVSYR